MTATDTVRICAITYLAVAVLIATGSDRLDAASWASAPTSDGTITIDMDSLGPSTRIAGVNGVWVQHAPTLPVDCSPPRGCYANTQRIYYNFSCAPRYAVLMERISMDLNGAIVKQEVSEVYTPANDVAATRVLNTFCPLRKRY